MKRSRYCPPPEISTTQKLTREILSHTMPIELINKDDWIPEMVGFWKGLWLRVTGRKPELVPPKLYMNASDTNMFRRPFALNVGIPTDNNNWYWYSADHDRELALCRKHNYVTNDDECPFCNQGE